MVNDEIGFSARYLKYHDSLFHRPTNKDAISDPVQKIWKDCATGARLNSRGIRDMSYTPGMFAQVTPSGFIQELNDPTPAFIQELNRPHPGPIPDPVIMRRIICCKLPAFHAKDHTDKSKSKAAVELAMFGKMYVMLKKHKK